MKMLLALLKNKAWRAAIRSELLFLILKSIMTLDYVQIIFTPHAQRERGKVIGRGVHIYTNNIQPFRVEYRYILYPR